MLDQPQIGLRLPRSDIREKVTGAAAYIADLTRPRLLHGALLGSPYAHARILSYDTMEARALKGVRAVLTGDDFPDGKMGAFIKDETAIAKGKVRYVGEPVAAVAADDESIARRAAQLIRVEYQELPALLSPEEALAPGAPLIHEDLDRYVKVFDARCHGNEMSYTEIVQGDLDRGFRDSDLVLENVWETPAQYHLSLEPCGALAEIDAAGRIHLWSANQSVFRVQSSVCETLGLPMSRLHCLTPRIGAGFGNKMEAHIQPIVVALAMAAKRPVKLILSREEDFEIVRSRHPFKVRCKTGVRADGTFLAREIEMTLDGGAFGDDSPGVLGYSALMAPGPYRFAHVKSFGRVAYTNKLRAGAFRGFGNPQVSFAGEMQIDEIARRLGRDPLDLREQNIIRGDDPWFGGQRLKSNGLAECVSSVRKASGWDGRKAAAAPKPDVIRGFGTALCGHISGLLATGAIVRLLEDGTIILNTGAVDIGQGSDTVLAQICAETLKLPMESVVHAAPDTDASPYNWGTTASRVTYTTGRAVVGAANEVALQIREQAAEMLDCAVEDLELRPGGIVAVTGGSNRFLSFAAISGRAHWAKGGPIVGSHSLVFDTPAIDPAAASVVGMPFRQIGVFSFAAMVVETETDIVTGKTSVPRAWVAADVGRAINPMMVEGQIEGGFVQGLGFALTEEMVWDGARLANPSLMDYKAPGFRDAPHEIHSIIVEHPEPDGPFGAKGVGEIGLVPVPAAIANALADATGACIRALPLSPERVLDALREGESDAP